MVKQKTTTRAKKASVNKKNKVSKNPQVKRNVRTPSETQSLSPRIPVIDGIKI